MTTSLWLLAVIDHSEPLPPEGKGLEKTIASALLGRPEIIGARVSQVRRQQGDSAGFSPLIPEARVGTGSAMAELAADVAQRCPHAADPGGPHLYLDGAASPRTCLACGALEGLIAQEFQELREDPEPLPAGPIIDPAPPELPAWKKGDPFCPQCRTPTKPGYVCRQCGAANPHAPASQEPPQPKLNAQGEVKCQHCGVEVKPDRLCSNCGKVPVTLRRVAQVIDPEHCPSSKPPGLPHDFSPTNVNRGRCCPRCGVANPNPPRPRPVPAEAYQNGTLMEG